MLSPAKSASGRIIGIDVSSVAYGTGVSTYTSNLIRHLIKVDQINSYKIFFSSLRLPLPPEIRDLQDKPNVKIYHFRFPLSFLEFLWNQLHIIPIEFFIGKCDVFHTSDWTQPPTILAKTLTTVHDLTPFTHPHWHVSRLIETHRRKLDLAVNYCKAFICVSQNTKNDLLHLYPQLKNSLVSVIYHGNESKYHQFLKLPLALQQKKKLAISKQYGLNKYILAQGTREPRKNLNRLIEAFNLYKKKFPASKIELAIAGKYGWGDDVNHLKNSSVKVLGFIPEKDMVALHASAICLAYPSLYEGFGFPIIKSMAVGVPVITSNTSSMAEIAKDSALLIDPTSVEALALAIEKIIKQTHLRRRLITAGLKRALDFTWTKTANQTLIVYQKICD